MSEAVRVQGIKREANQSAYKGPDSPASKLLYNCTANAAVKVLQFMSISQPSLYHLFIHLHSVAAAFIIVPVACQYGFF